MNARYLVELSQAERSELKAPLSGGKHSARKLKRAQILLAADAGASDEGIAASVGVGGSTVYRTRRRFVLGNLEAALSEEQRPGAARKLSGKEEALLIATAYSSPPAGRARWTLELLADALLRLTEHDSISRETVRRRLAENDLKPWRKEMWCIPQVDGEFVARMEDVLDLYAEPADPKRPIICFDETPIQLIGEVRQPIAAESGQLPFPLLHIDTSWKFREMIAFRDATAKRLGLELIVYVHEEGVANNINPIDSGSALHTRVADEQPAKKLVRFRSLGCYPLTAAI